MNVDGEPEPQNSDADSSVDELQLLLSQWSTRSPELKRRILERSLGRMRALAQKMLNESFPGLARLHDVDSVINESWMRLAQALERCDVPTVQDYYRLVAFKLRHVLLDMVRKRKHQLMPHMERSDGGPPEAVDLSDRTYDPVQLHAWTEFHERVAQLDEVERQVFEMHYYLELTQAQVATLLNIPPRQVSRHWIKATERLTKGIEWFRGLK